jgi:hypothetical protein
MMYMTPPVTSKVFWATDTHKCLVSKLANAQEVTKLTEGHEREEGTTPVHGEKDPVESDDAAVPLPDLAVRRQQPTCQEDGGDNAYD